MSLHPSPGIRPAASNSDGGAAAAPAGTARAGDPPNTLRLRPFLLALALAALFPAAGSARDFPGPPDPQAVPLTGMFQVVQCDNAACSLPSADDPRWVTSSLRPDGLDRPLPHREGVAWIRVQFSVPDPDAFKEPAILITRPADAEEVYFNGERAGGNGIIADRYATVPAGPRHVNLRPGSVRQGLNVLTMKVLFAGKNATVFDGPIRFGDRRVLRAPARGIRHSILVMESSYLTMWVFLIGFYGLLIAKKVVRSEYVLFVAFCIAAAVEFLLGSNVLRVSAGSSPTLEHAESLFASARSIVMIALVTSATESARGAFYRTAVGFGIAFLVANMLVSPMTYLTALAIPRKAYMAGIGVYLVALSARAALRRKEESVPILVGVAGYVAGTRLDLLLGVNLDEVGMGIFTVCMIYALISRHARMKDRLVDLSSRLLDAHEEERRRIARDLHDSVGQSLLALRLRLQRLAATGRRGEDIAPESVEAAAEDTRGVVEEVRRVAMDLRPAFLEKAGFEQAIRWYAENFGDRRGLAVRVHEAAEPVPDVPARVKDNVYRIFQEVLTNAAKHANATRIDVSLFRSPGGITLVVADDGKGFDAGAGDAGGLGINSMRERAALLDGNLTLAASAGTGTKVTLEVPLP